jgi:hypothetical protein
MKKILIAIGLIMAINTSWAQVSVDDDYFPAFVAAQKMVAEEQDSLRKLKDSSLTAEQIAQLPTNKQVIKLDEPVKDDENEISEDNYEITGKTVFCEQKVIGLRFNSMTRKQRFVLFKTIKKNISLEGIDKNYNNFTGTYLIPMSYWNNLTTGGSLTWEQLQYIKENFKL